MRVTTGGVTVGVGVLIVGALGVAGVLTVRDENDGRSPEGVECEPQSREMATAAQDAFVNEFIRPSRNSAFAGTVSVVVSSDAARERFGDEGDLPEWSDSGYVVIVDLERDEDHALPPCFDETPILYRSSRRLESD